MSKKYKIVQCSWSGGSLTEPIFPVTDDSMKEMLKSGIAKEVETHRASWGSGIYTKRDGEWVCIDEDWDTSG